jgi:hypothetical protein
MKQGTLRCASANVTGSGPRAALPSREIKSKCTNSVKGAHSASDRQTDKHTAVSLRLPDSGNSHLNLIVINWVTTQAHVTRSVSSPAAEVSKNGRPFKTRGSPQLYLRTQALTVASQMNLVHTVLLRSTLILSSSVCVSICLPSGLYLSSFQIKILHTLLTFPCLPHACPSHLTLLTTATRYRPTPVAAKY